MPNKEKAPKLVVYVHDQKGNLLQERPFYRRRFNDFCIKKAKEDDKRSFVFHDLQTNVFNFIRARSILA